MTEDTGGRENQTLATAASVIIKRGWARALDILRGKAERKRAEETLRESEERFRDLYDEAPIAYFSVGSDTRIRTANSGAVELLGYPKDELVGRVVFDLYADAPTGKAKAREVFRRFLADEEIRGEELEMRRANGMPVWISLWVRPVRDAQGQIVETRSAVMDITQRKRAEEALRESEEKYRDLVENLRDIIYEVDPAGRITFVSRAAEGTGGYGRSDIIGRLFTDFLHPDDRQRFVGNFQEAISSGVSNPNEYRLLSTRGETLWFRTSGQPIFEGDRFVGFRGVLTDITERKRMEEALEKAREELEARVEYQMLRRNPYGLTFRELTVLHLVAAGESDKQIGLTLGISPLTAQKHISNILDKMEADSRTEAGVRAVREGLLD